LVFGVEHVRNHSECYRSTCGAETTEQTRCQHVRPRGTGTGHSLPDVDSEKRQLHDRLSSELLGPGCPQFASNTVQDQKPSHTGSSVGKMVTTEMVVLIKRSYCVGVDRCVVICRQSVLQRLKSEDNHLLILVWQSPTTVKIVHLCFFVNLYPVFSTEFASVSISGPLDWA
jgi:hypothetical protein